MEMKTTLGQLINPEVLSDHFDHYGAPSLAKPSYDSNHNRMSRSMPASLLHKQARVELSPTEEVNSDDEFVEAPTHFINVQSKLQKGYVLVSYTNLLMM